MTRRVCIRCGTLQDAERGKPCEACGCSWFSLVPPAPLVTTVIEGMTVDGPEPLFPSPSTRTPTPGSSEASVVA